MAKPKKSLNSVKIDEMAERTTPKRAPRSRNKPKADVVDSIHEDTDIEVVSNVKKRGKKERVLHIVEGPTEISQISSALTNDEKDALLLQAAKNLDPLIEKKKKADSDIANFFSLAKAEGLIKKEILLVHTLVHAEEEDIKADFSRRQHILKLVWPHLADQAVFDFEGPSRMPAVDRAFAEGRSAGMSGDNCAAPYPKNTASESAWIDGWHAGQKVTFGKLKVFDLSEGHGPLEAEEIQIDGSKNTALN